MPNATPTEPGGSSDFLTAAPFALPLNQWHDAAELASQRAREAGTASPNFLRIVDELNGDFGYNDSGAFQMVMRGDDMAAVISAAKDLGLLNLDLPVPLADSRDGVDAVRAEVDRIYSFEADCEHDMAIDEDATPAKIAGLLATYQGKPWRTAEDWQRYGRAAIERMCRHSGGVHPKIAPYLDDIVDGESYGRVFEAAVLAPSANKPEPEPKRYVPRALPASLAPDPE